MTSGGGVDMSSWVDHVPALLEAWYPGQEGGTAVAQLLFGDFNPSGRLPISIERRPEDNATHDSYYPKPGSKKVEYTEGVFVGYRHYDKSTMKPLFPFGYGLSYTSFAYKNLTISPSSTNETTVAFDVTNTGNRAGSDVAESIRRRSACARPSPSQGIERFCENHVESG